jgi:heme-degrading monooxygenase HmoA
MAGEEQLEEGIRGFERGLDALRELEGVREAYLLVDRASGKAATMTLWESEGALRASEDVADRVRRDAAGDAVRSVERYEVVRRERFG